MSFSSLVPKPAASIKTLMPRLLIVLYLKHTHDAKVKGVPRGFTWFRKFVARGRGSFISLFCGCSEGHHKDCILPRSHSGAKRPYSERRMAVQLQRVLISDSVDASCRSILEEGGVAVDYRPGLTKEELIACVKVFST